MCLHETTKHKGYGNHFAPIRDRSNEIAVWKKFWKKIAVCYGKLWKKIAVWKKICKKFSVEYTPRRMREVSRWLVFEACGS